MMHRLVCTLLVLLLAAGLAATPEVRAQPKSAISQADKKKAIQHYKRGRQLFSSQRFDKALEQFDASLEFMPSPNTELLRAHALRELERRADAMASYESVRREATDRVGLGQSRYQRALEEARHWLTKLRPHVAELQVVVQHAPADLSLLADDQELTAARRPGDPSIVQVKTWHEAGPITVTVRWGDGEEQTRELDLVAGQEATMEFDLAPPESDSPKPSRPAASPQSPPERSDDFPAPPLPSWIAAGVGVVGFGMFAIFGSLSASTAADLDECAPACPAGLREDADAGETQQLVANVGLVVGVAGIAAAGTIWLIDGLTGEDAEPADEDTADGPDVALSVGPGSVLVRGRF